MVLRALTTAFGSFSLLLVACHAASSDAASSSAAAATAPPAGSGSASSAPNATAATQRSAFEMTLARNYCGTGFSGYLNALDDANGVTGGYTFSPPIPDSPVVYLDAQGNPIGSFHIFSTPQYTEADAGSIEAMQTRYPKSRSVCSPPKGSSATP